MSKPVSPSPSAIAATDNSDALGRALANPRIGGLDFLRAVSILLVLIEHASEYGGGSAIRPFVDGLSGLGVEVFFVLSGFLITWLLLAEWNQSGRIRYTDFYRRRIARLMPAFFAYLVFAIAILIWEGKAVPWPAVTSSILYVTNYYQAFTGAQSSIVSHCWSLSLEEQFYIVFPLALGGLLARRFGLARALALTIIAVWVYRWVALSLGAPVDYLYRALETRADHLAVGCLAAVLLSSDRWRSRVNAQFVRSWVFFLLAILTLCSARVDAISPTYKYGFGYMIEPVMIGLLIPFFAFCTETRQWGARILNHPLPVQIGKVSYGMYLFHGAIMFATVRLIEARTGSFTLGFLAACIALVVFASILFRWYETPMRKLINALGK